MQNRQKILFVSMIVLLALIALIEGIALLRYSKHGDKLAAILPKAIGSIIRPTENHQPQGEDSFARQDDIILHETAEDLERMKNQINRLFYEMAKDTAFPSHNLRPMNPAPDSPAPFENTRLGSPRNFGEAGEAWVRRLQSEIAQIFQKANENRHNGALNLIEQDWRDVGEISSVNMDEDGTNYVVTVSMPGFERTDINVSLNGRLLTIEAGTGRQRATRDSQTVSSGRFNTQIMLPSDITGESAQAFYENSILKIIIPRTPASNSLARKVTIM